MTEYPIPSIYSASPAFTLKANGRNIPIVDFSKQYDYTTFSFGGGRCELEVARLDGKPIERISVSPLKLNIAVKIVNGRAIFEVNKPAYLIVDIDKLRRLVIAIDPLETDRPPSTGSNIYNIAEPKYAADATAHLSSTTEIQRAIDDASKDPGKSGVVYIPNGVYLASHVILKSNVSLYLDSGAVLRCDGAREDFPVFFKKDSVNRQGTWFIYTEDGASNIKIFGRGTIDGNGKALIKRLNLLNHALVPINCSHFLVDGPTIRDSGLWGTVIARSDHVTFRNTKHFNLLDMGEDDGIDICESQDVRLERTVAISLDDSYSFKTWSAGTDISKHWTGKPEPIRNVMLEDCFAWSRCFGFKVGAGANQPEEGIAVHNSVVFDAAHGIGISHSYGTGNVQDVLFDTLDLERTTCECLGRSWCRFVIDERKGGEMGGNVSDVHLRDIIVRDAGTKPVSIYGASATAMFHGVTFENIRMPGKQKPATTLEEIGVKDAKFAERLIVK